MAPAPRPTLQHCARWLSRLRKSIVDYRVGGGRWLSRCPGAARGWSGRSGQVQQSTVRRQRRCPGGGGVQESNPMCAGLHRKPLWPVQSAEHVRPPCVISASLCSAVTGRVAPGSCSDEPCRSGAPGGGKRTGAAACAAQPACGSPITMRTGELMLGRGWATSKAIASHRH